MPLNESASFLTSTILSVLTFSTMQMLKPLLVSSQPMTLVGGFLGALLFVFLLTAVANLEKTVFGRGFQTKWLEVAACAAAAAAVSASVHRVCATSALLFAAAMLYVMNRMAEKEYGSGEKPQAAADAAKAKKKK